MWKISLGLFLALVVFMANDWYIYHRGFAEATTKEQLIAAQQAVITQQRTAQMYKGQLTKQQAAIDSLHLQSLEENKKLIEAQETLSTLPLNQQCTVGPQIIDLLNARMQDNESN